MVEFVFAASVSESWYSIVEAGDHMHYIHCLTLYLSVQMYAQYSALIDFHIGTKIVVSPAYPLLCKCVATVTMA